MKLSTWYILLLATGTTLVSTVTAESNYTATNVNNGGGHQVDSSENSFVVEKLSKLTDPYLNHASLLNRLPTNFHQTENSAKLQSQMMNEFQQRPTVAFLEKPIIGQSETLLDRTLTQARYNNLAAKMTKLIFVFFLESFLFQLYGVDLDD